jgi:hypothetical protein
LPTEGTAAEGAGFGLRRDQSRAEVRRPLGHIWSLVAAFGANGHSGLAGFTITPALTGIEARPRKERHGASILSGGDSRGGWWRSRGMAVHGDRHAAARRCQRSRSMETRAGRSAQETPRGRAIPCGEDRIVSIAFDPTRVDYEMAIRGLSGSDLAGKAGVCDATVSTARRGRPISSDSARRIAAALMATPIDPALVRLVPRPDGGDDD